MMMMNPFHRTTGSKLWRVPALLSLLVLVSTLVTPTHAKSFVSVHIPFELHNRSGEEHVTAGYGIAHPQGSIAAYVYTTDESLCNGWNTKNGTDGYPQHDGGMKAPYMLLVQRSTLCTAVTQARHAQINGAAALIVAHDVCRCSDKACTDVYGPECVNNEEDELLVNDGSAGDVTIPSFLLYRVRAHAIRDQLLKNQPVLMEFTWGLKDKELDQKTPAVHFQLWTTAHDPLLDLETYKNFKVIATALAPGGARFEPRFAIIPGERFHCNQQIDTNGPCDHLCTNHGRYCALHGYELSGHAIVNETLRRLCIWQDFGSKDAVQYWDYILYHLEHCPGPDKFIDHDCVTQALTAAKVDPTRVDQCMMDSGGLDADDVNPLLEYQLHQQSRTGILALPALVVENRTLDEPTSFHLWEGLCRRFWTLNLTTTPDVCFTCGSCPNVIGCLETGHCVDFSKPVEPPPSKQDTKKRHHHGWTTFWVISILGAAGYAVYYYKKQQDAEGVRGGVLSNYFQLAGEEM
jgi:hypothetical protein